MTRAAIITGSATGLGVRTAVELALHGVSIGINYVQSKSEAEDLAAYLRSHFNVKAVTIQGNVAKSTEAGSVVKQFIREFGRVDILINNAGPFIHCRKKMADYSDMEWYQMIDGNLSSAFFMSRLVLPAMRERKWGRIINIGYDRCETAPGWVYRSAYAAAKTGLVALSRTLALEEAANGITVNVVCPGDIKVPWKDADIEQARVSANNQGAIERTGTGQDVGRVISFLCDQNSDYVTGAVISVNGNVDVLSRHRPKVTTDI